MIDILLNSRLRKHLPLLLCLLAAPAAAASVKCETQNLNGHASKICVNGGQFSHDYYTLIVDNTIIFTLPDDYVEDIVLSHRVPEDAAIEFPATGTTRAGAVVKITGGCLPISEKQSIGGKTVGVEVARTCSFRWGDVEGLKDIRLTFD